MNNFIGIIFIAGDDVRDLLKCMCRVRVPLRVSGMGVRGMQ